MAIDSHGRIIVAGISDTGGKFDFAETNYNSDGSLDLSFGASGKITTALGPGVDFGVGVVDPHDFPRLEWVFA